jgi:hypothetical protein
MADVLFSSISSQLKAFRKQCGERNADWEDPLHVESKTGTLGTKLVGNIKVLPKPPHILWASNPPSRLLVWSGIATGRLHKFVF